jgi:hypothetical protein
LSIFRSSAQIRFNYLTLHTFFGAVTATIAIDARRFDLHDLAQISAGKPKALQASAACLKCRHRLEGQP